MTDTDNNRVFEGEEGTGEQNAAVPAEGGLRVRDTDDGIPADAVQGSLEEVSGQAAGGGSGEVQSFDMGEISGKEVDKKLLKIGMINPDTGEPIKDRAEYEKVRKSRHAEERHQFMKNNNMTERQYYDFVGGLPEVQAARVAEERAVNIQIETQLNDEIRQLGELDSSIKSMSDLRQSPAYGKIVELVNRGSRLVDAFKLANFDTLTQNAAEKGRQAALNSIQNRSHLTPVSKMSGNGLQSVPKAVMSQYRLFNPGASDEEIQNHYNRELRKGL